MPVRPTDSGQTDDRAGAKHRIRRWPELTPSSPTVEAVTLTLVNAGCLWWWTWCQFCFGWAIGSWVIFGYAGLLALGTYVPVAGPMNFHEFSLAISILFAVVAFALTWMHTRQSRYRYRQFGLIALFSAIAVAQPLSYVRSEATVYHRAQSQISDQRAYLDETLAIRQGLYAEGDAEGVADMDSWIPYMQRALANSQAIIDAYLASRPAPADAP
ncbi:hypothetical protein BH23VER1_BH23VER1_13170 [soil metagenome]